VGSSRCTTRQRLDNLTPASVDLLQVGLCDADDTVTIDAMEGIDWMQRLDRHTYESAG